MLLKNYQYNAILRIYDNRRLNNKHELDQRRKEVYQLFPELSEIDDKIASDSVKSAKAALFGNATALEELKKSNQQLSAQKQKILMDHGYEPDYLKMRYQCSDCQDTGYIDSEKCHCFKQAIVDLIYAQSNVKTAIQTENFDTFCNWYYSDSYIDESINLSPFENMTRIIDKVKKFISNFDTGYKNLLIYGETGVGKTFLSNCIAKELLESGHAVIYLTAFQFFQIMENYKFNKNEDNHEFFQNQFDYILECDLLLIDDLGTEVNNTFVSSQLYLCMDERHLRKKATIISTNLSLIQLSRNYSERIYSRISSNYTLLKIVGEDIRIEKTNFIDRKQ